MRAVLVRAWFVQNFTVIVINPTSNYANVQDELMLHAYEGVRIKQKNCG